jgi:hypothetical protein
MRACRRPLFVLTASLVSSAAWSGPPVPCPVGLVWREATPDDFVCVPPATRERTRQENDRAAQRHETGPGASGPDTCHQGFVWRNAFPGDRVCVRPEERDQVAVDNRTSAQRTSPLQQGPHGPNVCRAGSVWRGARPGDVVCVSPERREQAHRDNALAASRRGNDVCLPGFVWRGAVYGDVACVTPAERDQAARDNACLQYAVTAIVQQRRNLDLRCQLAGDAWSWDVANHFTWCTGVDGARSGTEQARREADLASCARRAAGGGGGGVPPTPGPGGGLQCCWTAIGTPSGPANIHLCAAGRCPCRSGCS